MTGPGVASGSPSPTATVVYWQDLEHLPRDGGGQRVLAWVRALEELGFTTTVTGLQSPAATAGGKGGRLGAVKRAVLPLPLRRSLPTSHADVVVATVPATFVDAVAGLGTGGRRTLVLDWMDRWSAIAETWAAHHPRRVTRWGARVQAARWRRAEADVVSRAPAQVFAGHGDLEGARRLGAVNAHWLATPCAASGRRAGEPAPVRVVGFIGNFAYTPNRDAVTWFARAHLPRLRLEGVRVVIGGFGSDDLDLPPGIERCGVVEDVDEFYRAVDAVVVPVRIGGGIKVKAVEAMVRGVPVLGTEHVREGLPPALRPFVHDLEALHAGVRLGVPGPAALDVFSEQAFRDGVRATLTGAGAGDLVAGGPMC